MDNERDPSGVSGAGEQRGRFLSRVRAALGRPRPSEGPPPPPPAIDDALIRTAPAAADLAELFAARATAVGMTVYRIPAADVVKRVLALLAELNVKRVVTGVGSLPQALGLNEALRRKGVEVVDWRADAPAGAATRLEAQFDADAGITDVHAAIAETGTLVCNADAGHSRGLSLVPPIHVAIVRASAIVADLVDYMAQLQRRVAGADPRNGRSPSSMRWGVEDSTPGTQTKNDDSAAATKNPHPASGRPLPKKGEGVRLPSSMVLITGPSKTADIEGILITGMHGPGQVHAMLVDDA